MPALSSEMLEEMYQAAGIPISVFRGGELLHTFSSSADFNFPMILLSGIQEQNAPIWYAVTPEDLCFSGCSLPDKTVCFFGPILPYECTEARTARILSAYGRKPSEFYDIMSYFNVHSHSGISALQAAAKLCYRFASGENPPEPVQASFQMNTDLPIPEIVTPEASAYETQELESRLFSYVLHGDVEAISRLTYAVIRPQTAAGIPNLKMFKSYEIGAIALASRAAMEGGVDYALATEYRTRFYSQVTGSSDFYDDSGIFIRAHITFAQLVANVHRFPVNGAVSQRAVTYVQGHLYEKLTPTIVARALGMNLSYLCAQFKKESGMTLGTCISRSKIGEAKRLLETTGSSSLSIAELLCFSSVSYFGKVFLKYEGMTPGQYRKSRRNGSHRAE